MVAHITPAAATLLALIVAACGSQAREEPAATAASEPPPLVITPQVLEHGRATYKLNCVPCHGEGGRGDGPSSGNLDPKPRDHTNPEYMNTLADDEIRRTVQYGGAIRGMPQMPSSPHIQGYEMAALIAYVRSLSAAEHAASRR